ncbi:MAG: beta-ketoacyl synthase chain length factor [Proteobacteria bacterium]|nr:beta-ketoacyl synthase chain length factor [Pseudomonadota bacterium]
MSACVAGLGLLGPGLPDWDRGRAILSGASDWHADTTLIPSLTCLPSAERRRTGVPVRIALTAGLQACSHAGVDPATLPAVFTSSGGDGENLHEICTALAAGERQLSPTRFHNSVHNAPSGYWSIATGATPASNALCAHDASFAAGLLEALAQLHAEQRAVLLVAYDAPYPEPLRTVRPIPHAFAVALVLTLQPTPTALARLEVAVGEAPPSTLPSGGLEELRARIPAARSLPMLAQIARAESGTVVLDYLGTLTLSVKVRACP